MLKYLITLKTTAKKLSSLDPGMSLQLFSHCLSTNLFKRLLTLCVPRLTHVVLWSLFLVLKLVLELSSS